MAGKGGDKEKGGGEFLDSKFRREYVAKYNYSFSQPPEAKPSKKGR